MCHQACIWSVSAVYVYMLVLLYPLEDSVVTTNYLTTYTTNKIFTEFNALLVIYILAKWVGSQFYMYDVT